eukprot:Opistho-1_new@42865
MDGSRSPLAPSSPGGFDIARARAMLATFQQAQARRQEGSSADSTPLLRSSDALSVPSVSGGGSLASSPMKEKETPVPQSQSVTSPMVTTRSPGVAPAVVVASASQDVIPPLDLAKLTEGWTDDDWLYSIPSRPLSVIERAMSVDEWLHQDDGDDEAAQDPLMSTYTLSSVSLGAQSNPAYAAGMRTFPPSPSSADASATKEQTSSFGKFVRSSTAPLQLQQEAPAAPSVAPAPTPAPAPAPASAVTRSSAAASYSSAPAQSSMR